MKSIYLILLLIFINILNLFVFCEEPINNNSDTYLAALQNSHDVDTLSDARLAPSSNFINDYDHQSTGPDYGSGSFSGYDYQPKPQYGPPSPHIPDTHYGPAPVYGPPIQRPLYGPPIYHPAPPTHFIPRESWFFDKFKLKFDLFTIGKILLKILIFKKIVKFLALICLLLFLPKLYHHDKDDGGGHGGDDDRTFSEHYNLKKRLNEISIFSKTALEAFSKKYDKKSCVDSLDVTCRFSNMFDVIDKKYPYGKIVRMYLPDNDKSIPEVNGE